MRGNPNETDAIIGGNIRAIRKELSLSQAALGERLGITFQQIQKYENGKNRLSVARMVDMARTLDRPISDFVAGVEGVRVA